MDTPVAGDEVWTVGQAADYLNAGPVRLVSTTKRVRRMAQDPGCQIRSIVGGVDTLGRRHWFKLVASTVRAERARLLGLAGFEDPDWPPQPVAG